MKLKVYTRFLTITSTLLNFCVKYELWSTAKHLIEFRKHHIARTMRASLSQS
jgi:hypothetical protein